MKRIFSVPTAIILAIMLLFSSCGLLADGGEKETVKPITEPSVTEKPTEKPTVPVTEPPTETEPATEKTTVIDVTEKEPESHSRYSGEEIDKGVTSKGYKITEKDGITYINGIMIANKTYSLPYDYNPGKLTSDCQAAFNEMKQSAAEDGCDIYVSSGFRSYSLQKSLYNRYCARDGKAAADRYSARPGNSEHQTGYAIDLNTIAYSFADTAEGKWVAENCYKYGFILRYPQDKEEQTGYRYEPWHIRYVGIALATEIHNSGLCLEEYFGITSRYS